MTFFFLVRMTCDFAVKPFAFSIYVWFSLKLYIFLFYGIYQTVINNLERLIWVTLKFVFLSAFNLLFSVWKETGRYAKLYQGWNWTPGVSDFSEAITYSPVLLPHSLCIWPFPTVVQCLRNTLHLQTFAMDMRKIAYSPWSLHIRNVSASLKS